MPAFALPILSFLKSRLGIGLIAAIALALLWARGTHYRNDRDAWKSAFAAQKAAMVAAQQEAQAKAIAAKLATENKYAQIAQEADNDRQDVLRALAADYSRRMRTKAVADTRGGTVAPGEGNTAPRDNGSGEAAEYVAVRPDDYDTLIENTLRLKQAHEWGERLIAEGLAKEPVDVEAVNPAFGD